MSDGTDMDDDSLRRRELAAAWSLLVKGMGEFIEDHDRVGLRRLAYLDAAIAAYRTARKLPESHLLQQPHLATAFLGVAVNPVRRLFGDHLPPDDLITLPVLRHAAGIYLGAGIFGDTVSMLVCDGILLLHPKDPAIFWWVGEDSVATLGETLAVAALGEVTRRRTGMKAARPRPIRLYRNPWEWLMDGNTPLAWRRANPRCRRGVVILDWDAPLVHELLLWCPGFVCDDREHVDEVRRRCKAARRAVVPARKPRILVSEQ